MTATAGVRVDLHTDIEGKLPAVVELAVFRIVQEALTNIVRHARAGSASISLTSNNGTVVVEVTDDGTSPTHGKPGEHGGREEPAGFGLIGMKGAPPRSGARSSSDSSQAAGFAYMHCFRLTEAGHDGALPTCG